MLSSIYRRHKHSLNQFYVTVTLVASSIKCSIRPCFQTNTRGISTVFAREYLNGFVGEATIGILHEKRTWPVRIKISHVSGRTFMIGGWKSFSQHYKLQVNDVCVFEMTQHTPLSFKVIIFPARE
ncbi:unnamed protein product [Lupinus luteus]|uniref:TF-B3 domain-containing protein n=1 Tax=Lupinus luteus TaxID=3873 RepID=A0AAV1XB73_LUPLU